MRATFEHAGNIIDIGSNIVGSELDTTQHNWASSTAPGTVCVAVYARDLVDPHIVRSRASFCMKSSEARAMASALLSAATEAKAS